jgi:hypothetical protein
MQLTVHRYMKPFTPTHMAKLFLTHGNPVPSMYAFMQERKIADLARLWAVLDGRFIDERLDGNAILARGVARWTDLTLKDLSSSGFEFEADPIVVAAVEEAARRALQVLFIMDDYAARYGRAQQDYELGTADAEPTGLAAVPPESSIGAG